MKYVARVLTAMVAAAVFPVFFLLPLLKARYSVILAGENELTLSLKEMLFPVMGSYRSANSLNWTPCSH